MACNSKPDVYLACNDNKPRLGIRSSKFTITKLSFFYISPTKTYRINVWLYKPVLTNQHM